MSSHGKIVRLTAVLTLYDNFSGKALIAEFYSLVRKL